MNKSMNRKLGLMNYESVDTETYVTEIFDMVGIAHKITLPGIYNHS